MKKLFTLYVMMFLALPGCSDKDDPEAAKPPSPAPPTLNTSDDVESIIDRKIAEIQQKPKNIFPVPPSDLSLLEILFRYATYDGQQLTCTGSAYLHTIFYDRFQSGEISYYALKFQDTGPTGNQPTGLWIYASLSYYPGQEKKFLSACRGRDLPLDEWFPIRLKIKFDHANDPLYWATITNWQFWDDRSNQWGPWVEKYK